MRPQACWWRMPGWPLSSEIFAPPGRSALACPIWRITSLAMIDNDVIRQIGLAIEQRDIRAAGPLGVGLPHLADHVVVDHRQDFRPERRLGDVGVDIDEEIILVA